MYVRKRLSTNKGKRITTIGAREEILRRADIDDRVASNHSHHGHVEFIISMQRNGHSFTVVFLGEQDF
jgi:hypothetical protein